MSNTIKLNKKKGIEQTMNFFECMREIEQKVIGNCFTDNIEKIIIKIEKKDENIHIYIKEVDGRLQFVSEDITFYDCAAFYLDEDFIILYKYK